MGVMLVLISYLVMVSLTAFIIVKLNAVYGDGEFDKEDKQVLYKLALIWPLAWLAGICVLAKIVLLDWPITMAQKATKNNEENKA